MSTKIMKRISRVSRPVLISMALFIFCFSGLSLAEQNEQEKASVEVEMVEIKRVQGEVSSITTPNNPRYIGITYKEDEKNATAYEVVLYIDKDIKLMHKRSLSQIGIGDTVEITYEFITKTTADGRKETRRVAKKIRFIRTADKETLRKYGLIEDEWEE